MMMATVSLMVVTFVPMWARGDGRASARGDPSLKPEGQPSKYRAADCLTVTDIAGA